MKALAWMALAAGVTGMIATSEAATYRRSCSGGLWVSYHSDSHHLHTLGWLNGQRAVATARSNHFRPNTLRGRARDRLKNDCFQHLSCTGETEVAGYPVDMSTPWPYATTYDEIAAQIQEAVCQDARLNFRDVRLIRAQLRITGDENCGLSDGKNFYADFLQQGNLGSAEVICSGRYPR